MRQYSTYDLQRRLIPSLFITILFLCSSCNNATTAQPPNTQQLISKAQTAINKLTAYHFNLNTTDPGNNTADLVTVTGADGDIVVPDKMQANANALAAGFSIQVKIIATGGKEYYTDPITGDWKSISNILDPRTLTDPQTGVAGIIGHIQNPSKPTSSTVDGTPCWSINGTLATSYITAITGDGTPSASTVATTICIGTTDNELYQLQIKGVALQGDKTTTLRTFKLSKFDEHLTITAPTIK